VRKLIDFNVAIAEPESRIGDELVEWNVGNVVSRCWGIAIGLAKQGNLWAPVLVCVAAKLCSAVACCINGAC
jgi:mannose/fructose/N-acetylgalactosamine-specific phosphotransferase system component IID